MDARGELIIDWALNNKQLLNLKVKNYTWVNKWLRGFNDVLVEITIDDKKYFGRATDMSFDLAFLKAFLEAVERTFILWNSLPHSNGIAIHIKEEEAISNSVKELIERDLFFCHYLTETPFYSIPNFNQLILSNNEVVRSIFSCLRKLESQDIFFHFLLTKQIGNYLSVVCIGDGENYSQKFGICVGMGCETNLVHAVLKSAIECLRHVVCIIENKENSFLNLQEFLQIETHSIENQLSLANSPNYKKILWDFTRTKENLEKDSQSDNIIDSIQTSKLLVPDYLKDLPLFCYHSHSKMTQDLFFGITTNEKINYKRLSSFSMKEINFSNVFKTPHPFG